MTDFDVDVDHEIRRTDRSLGARDHDAGELRAVTITKVYDGTVEELWDAVTSAERIPRWFLPISGDLRLGGRYQLEGNAGGEITACDPPHAFDATWVYQAEGMPDPGVSWIEVRLAAEGEGQVRLTLVHVAEVDDTMWDQFGPGAVGIGWDQGLLGLSRHLATGAAVDAAAAMAWMAGDEGKRFTTLSGEGWYAAEVAAGVDEPTARRHADATIAAYTAWDPDAG